MLYLFLSKLKCNVLDKKLLENKSVYCYKNERLQEANYLENIQLHP